MKRNTMKKLIIFSSLLLLIFGIGFSQGKEVAFKDYNGYEWDKFTLGMKLGFVVGFFIGIQTCENQISFLYSIEKDEKLKKGLGMTYTTIRLSYDIAGVRFGQLVDGTDEVYRDYANKHIPIYEILPLVAQRARGEIDNKKMESRLQSLRKKYSGK
jgi:hypothetical protein